jgi:hypothetical protein
LIAVALAAWAVLTTISGGLHIGVGGLEVSSRNPVRPAAVAILLAALAWLLDPAWAETWTKRLTAAVGPAVRRFAVPLAALCLFVTAVAFTVRAAVAADAFGYLSQSVMWLRGGLTIDQPFAAEVPWPNADWTFSPLGYRPGSGHVLVPTYAPGLPLLMSAGRILSACWPFYIAPLAGAVLVLLTAALGRRLFGRATATAAAVMVAASPVVIWWSLAPMTDVPVAAFWIAALLAADRPRLSGAALAGLLSGIAIAIRPNLAPLALFPLLLSAVHGGGRNAIVARSAALIAAVLPFVVFVGLVHRALYGSPFTSGYGTASTIYSFRHALTNLVRYPSWWWHAHGLVGWLFLVAVFRPRPVATRARVAILVLFAAAVGMAYVFYMPFDEWAYLRFVISALPVVMLLSADAIAWLTSRRGAALCAAALSACSALAVVQGIHRARWDGFFRFADNDQAFVDAAMYIDATAPAPSVVFSMLHSGSVRYYAGRQTLRFDILDPQWLDRAVAALAERGFRSYALLEDYEVRAFRDRFAGQETLAMLNRGPMAIRHKVGGDVRLYALSSSAAGENGAAIEMPRTSRFDCWEPSSRFGHEMEPPP